MLAELDEAQLSAPAYDKNAWKPVLINILGHEPAGKEIPVRRMNRFWWAAAAILLIVVSISGYFIFRKPEAKEIAVAAPKINDVAAPTTNKATITLADGSKVLLDSMNSGTVATQGNVKVEKNAKGEIMYQLAGDEKAATVQYNTLFNPRGSRAISLTLADGSQVWLNAASSLTYPTVFTGTERKVTITGEAYFEVAHNPAMPFSVSKGGMTVQVLGTHFNVNAYEDESDIKVTLLEGSVKVTADNGQRSAVVKPGQQARVNAGIQVLNGVDLEEVMGWKNGLFKFNGTDIQSMMRQAERWYDITVSYPRGIPAEKFGGTLSRDVNLSDFIKILEYSDVKAKIEGSKVIVMR